MAMDEDFEDYWANQQFEQMRQDKLNRNRYDPFYIQELRSREQSRANIQRYLKRKEKENMVEFAKGINVKTVDTKYGKIIKLGINYEKLGENPITPTGWVNIDLMTSKTGNLYAVPNTYQPPQKAENNTTVSDVQFGEFSDEEIPF